MQDRSVLILGGGLSGVATAYTLARAGVKDITIVERGRSLGGLADSFEHDGHFYPLGYHHILHRDRALLFFLQEIGALPDVRWRKIRMLFRVQGRNYDLASPAGFLRFPMAPADKLRFVRLMLRAFSKQDWSDWEGRSAADLVDTLGSPGVRRSIFEPLTRLKFELGSEHVSGAWLGSRLHFREGSAPLGYIPNTNWTTVLCDGVSRLISDMGVRVRLQSSVVKLHTAGDRIHEAELMNGKRIGADMFVSTIPTEVYTTLVPRDETPHLANIRYTALLSAICATRQKISPEFYWMNLEPGNYTACGIFTLSSLNPTIGEPGDTCLNFVTHLNSRARPLFRESDEELLARYAGDFCRIFGARLDPIWSHISRVAMYSPIFSPDWQNPPVRSASWRNVYFAGNYRTFPSVVSTGTALGAGVETARVILEGHGIGTDLPSAIDRFQLGKMRRA